MKKQNIQALSYNIIQRLRPGKQLTIDCLDASTVVIWELKVFSVKPLVEWGHDGGGVIGVLQTQSMTQLMDGYQENIITFKETEKFKVWFVLVSSRIYNSLLNLLFLTSLVDLPGGPGLSEVKVCVSPDAIARKVSVSQKAALAIERRAVTVEPLREGQHDVCILVDLASDLTEGDLSEGEWDRSLPHPEGLSDGFISSMLAYFRGVVLYAVRKEEPEV